MNFKKLGLGLVATAAMTTGVSIADKPAEAATIDRLVVDLTGEVNSIMTSNVGGTSALDIDLSSAINGGKVFSGTAPAASPSTGLFASFVGGTVAVKDLLDPYSFNPINDFIVLTKGAQTLKFKLASLTPTVPSNPYVFSANLQGIFSPGGFSTAVAPLSAIATFDTTPGQSGGAGGSIVILADTTPIPTPALLPGLIGMGLAAMRKRKGEQVEHSETVKA